MIGWIATASVLVAAVACWAWWHRREQHRAAEFRRAAQQLADVEAPVVFVATHFWFPALGRYGEYSEDAQRMLTRFVEALPEELHGLSVRVEAVRAQIAATGELDDDRCTALRALFDAIAERGGIDHELDTSLAAGELDWDPGNVDDPAEGSPTDAQLRVLDDLRRDLANGRSKAVLQDVNARIEEEDVQGVFRAALLDCRGRALAELDRPEEAVRDFEEAARLAPEIDVRELTGGREGG